MSASTSKITKVAKRACDACKIRKIKCSEHQPCSACVASGISCTFIKPSYARGPRKLRKETLDEIHQTQRQWQNFESTAPATAAAPAEPVVHTQLTAESVFSPSKVSSLVLQLCIYRLRVYPVWPILKIERLVASLQQLQPDIEVFALAYAVAAATIAQIRQKPSTQPGAVTAEMMLNQCLYAKEQRNPNLPPDLTTVRIPFFLHIYYENVEPGGMKSVLYLREAIAIAHLLGLHRESYYATVQAEEQEIRRRTYWLLFIAERSIAISYKLPVIIKTAINLPSIRDSDEKEVLMGYKNLVGLYWMLEEAQVFELLDHRHFWLEKASDQIASKKHLLITCLRKLNEYSVDATTISETQSVDISVSRQWMRMIVWQLMGEVPSQDLNILANGAPNFPLLVAQELLLSVSQLPEMAVEAHGPNLENKIFDIASVIIDGLKQIPHTGTSPPLDSRPSQEVLVGLQRLLIKNKTLDTRMRDQLSLLEQNGMIQPMSQTTEWLLNQQRSGSDMGFMDHDENGSPLSHLSSNTNHSNTQRAQTQVQPAANWPTDEQMLNPISISPIPYLDDWQLMNFGLNSLDPDAPNVFDPSNDHKGPEQPAGWR